MRKARRHGGTGTEGRRAAGQERRWETRNWVYPYNGGCPKPPYMGGLPGFESVASFNWTDGENTPVGCRRDRSGKCEFRGFPGFLIAPNDRCTFWRQLMPGFVVAPLLDREENRAVEMGGACPHRPNMSIFRLISPVFVATLL